MAKKNTLVQTTTFKNNLDLLNANKPKNTYGILTDDPIIAATPQYKKIAVGTSSGSSTKIPVTLKLGDYSYNDIYNTLYASYGGGKSSGGYNVKKTDISGVLEALEKEAQSLRDVASSTYNQNKKSAQSAYDLAAKNARSALSAAFELAQSSYDTSSQSAKKSYETTRNDLLTSIKRFQEQNARDVQQQKQDYLKEQAALEAAREAVNRQNRISSSARGLGGSGLQQLAQMQNLINQGQQISELAGENQNIRENLARALAEAEEDNAADMAKNQASYDSALKQAQTALSNAKRQAQTEYDIDIDTAATTLNDLLSNADTDYNNTLAKIASNLRTQREDRISANEAAYTNAVNQARAQAAQIAASNKAAAASAKQEARSLVNLLNSTQTQYEKELKALDSMSDKDLKKLAKETYGLSKNATKRQVANAINDKYQNLMTSVDPKALGYATQHGLSKGNINTYTNNLNSLLKYYGY